MDPSDVFRYPGAKASGLQVRDKILEGLRAAGLKSGDRLPSIRELARVYACGESAVRQAVELLKADGHLESRDRSGLYFKELSEPEGSHEEGVELALRETMPYCFPGLRQEVRLRVSLLDCTPSQRRMWDGVFKSFERRHAGVKVAGSFGDNTANHAKAPANLMPDIVQLGCERVAEFVAKGLLLPVPSAGDLAAKCPPGSLDSGRAKGELYGLPLYVTIHLQQANQAHLKELGLALDWESYGYHDFIGACAEFAKRHHDEIRRGEWLVLASQVNPAAYLAGYSDEIFQAATRRFDWTRPAALEFFRSFAQVIRPFQETTTDWNVIRGYFDRGNALFTTRHSYAYNELPASAREGLLPFPVTPRGMNLYWANYHAVTVGSGHIDEAFAFLAHLLSDEVAEWLDSQGYLHFLGGGLKPETRQSAVEKKMFRQAAPFMRYGADNCKYLEGNFLPAYYSVRSGTLSPENAVEKLVLTYEGFIKHGGENPLEDKQ